MLYQIGLILILIAVALIVSQRFKKNDNDNLIYEDEMSKDELDDIDENLN
jgi:hypothetical protein